VAECEGDDAVGGGGFEVVVDEVGVTVDGEGEELVAESHRRSMAAGRVNSRARVTV
jgi:hypothetical protein